MASWSDVRRYALALPGASEERTSSGKRAWIVNTKFFTWERPLRKSDLAALGEDAPAGPILGVYTGDLHLKEAMIASDSGVFFTTPHFDGYPAVLIRLKKITGPNLKDVITEAWIARAPKRAAREFLATRQEPRASRRRSR